jgi:nucleoside-diphosphate-sugar epimerase
VQAIVGYDAKIRALVRDIPRAQGLGPEFSHLEFVEGDLANNAALEKLCAGVDVVIHLAGAIAARSEDEFMKVNRDGTANLAAAARDAGVTRFIHISSLAAREPELSGYAASKAAGEQVLQTGVGGEMAWVIVRPPAVYGPGDKATLPLLKALLQRYAILPGRVESRFSMIYVDDLADAVMVLVDDAQLDGSVVELDDGAENGYSWHELVALASQITGHPGKPVFLPQFVLNLVASAISVFARLTGVVPMVTAGKVRELYHRDWVSRQRGLQERELWQPKIEFAGGFKKTLAWYNVENWL